MHQYNEFVDLKGQSSPRVDVYISDYLELCSRSQLKSHLCQLTINHKKAKLSQKVNNGDHLSFALKDNRVLFEKQDLPLTIIYEDQNVIVINKEQGVAVHPGAGRLNGTVANALAFRLAQEFSSESDNDDYIEQNSRPGIVHRLDMDTSGVLVCAKNMVTHLFLANQFKARKVQKRYMAIVQGHLTPSIGVIDNYMARSRRNHKLFTCGDDDSRGKQATTRYRVLLNRSSNDLVLFKPITGRTHQLRVHAQYLGHPIIGDRLYNPTASPYPLMLHAWKIKIRLPGEKDARVFVAPVPPRFYQCLNNQPISSSSSLSAIKN